MLANPQQFILIYGRSLLLDGVELTLRQNGRFPIIHISDHTALDNVPTGTIIYDQDQVDETAVYQLITNYPGWQFVGLTASQKNLLHIQSKTYNGRSLTTVLDTIYQ